MSTFELGDKGEAVMHHELSQYYCDVRVVPKQINLQLAWADMVVNQHPGLGYKNKRIEVKTEKTHTGNLFFETLSNQQTGRAGWAATSPADELYYLFWDMGTGYYIPGFQDVKWLFDYHKKDFPLVEQRKNVQDNITQGRLVPIDWLAQNYTGVVQFDFAATKKELFNE